MFRFILGRKSLKNKLKNERLACTGSPFSGNGASARNPHFHECLLVTIMMVRWYEILDSTGICDDRACNTPKEHY